MVVSKRGAELVPGKEQPGGCLDFAALGFRLFRGTDELGQSFAGRVPETLDRDVEAGASDDLLTVAKRSRLSGDSACAREKDVERAGFSVRRVTDICAPADDGRE